MQKLSVRIYILMPIAWFAMVLISTLFEVAFGQIRDPAGQILRLGVGVGVLIGVATAIFYFADRRLLQRESERIERFRNDPPPQ